MKQCDYSGTIINKSSKSTQVSAYADDIGRSNRTKPRLIEVYKEIEANGKDMGLVINADQKCVCIRNEHQKIDEGL